MGGTNPDPGVDLAPRDRAAEVAATRRGLLAAAPGLFAGGLLASTAAGQEGTPTPTTSSTDGTAAGSGGAWPLPRGDPANTGVAAGVGPVASARRRWRTGLDAEPVGTPVVAGGSVYVAADDGTVTALALADGSERWRVEVADGPLGAPAVDDGSVYVGGGGRLVALSTADGSERWAVETESDDPVPLTVADGTLYAGGTALTAHATGDGSERWRHDPEGAVTERPAAADGTVYAATPLAVLALDATDRGRRRWRVERDGSGAPAVADDTVYVGGEDGLVALAATDGTERWRYDPTTGFAPPPALGDRAYVGATDAGTDTLAALDAGGSPAWEAAVELGGAPVLVEGTLLLPGGDGLVAVAASDGTVRYEYTDPDESARSFTAPALAGGLAVVGDGDGVQAVESPRSGARFDIDRLAAGLERARKRGLVVDGVAEELRAARDAFDAGEYDTAGRRARAGWDVLASTREAAAAARQRIDRLASQVEGTDGASAAREKLDAARSAYEQGDYGAANRTAVEGLELLNATRRRKQTAASRISDLEELVESGSFGANSVPARLLERARTARDRGDYGNATALAERGIAAARARRKMRSARGSAVPPVVQDVADLFGRADALRAARRAYEQGDYRTALSKASNASTAVKLGWVGAGLGGLLGVLVLGAVAYGTHRVLLGLVETVEVAVALVRTGVRGVVGRVRGAVGAVAGALTPGSGDDASGDGAGTEASSAGVGNGASGAGDGSGSGTVGGILGGREARKHDRAEETIDEAEAAVGDPTRAGFVAPGEWTDRRVQCPQCSQFAATEGGEVAPPTAECSSCGWEGDRGWLTDHGHYDPGAGEGPVRPAVEKLRRARDVLGDGLYANAVEFAEEAHAAAEAEGPALAAIESADGAIDDPTRGGFGTPPGEWTDRRVQCPECSQFAATEGGDGTPPAAECSNCGWTAARDWLVEHDHYAPSEAGEPVRLSVARRYRSRRLLADGEYEAARELAERAAAAAEAEREVLPAIEDAQARIDEDVAGAPTDEAADLLAEARDALAAADHERAAELAAEAERTAAAPVDRLVEEAREHATGAAEAVDRGEYGAAIDAYEAALDSYATARDRAAAAGDDEAVSDIDGARETVRSNLAAARLAKLDDRLDDARSELDAAAEAGDADAAAAAEDAFEAALADLREVDPADHGDEQEGLLTRARQGVVEARVEQGRAEMERAEELFAAGEYSDARERFEAVAGRFEETLATADEYGLDDAREELDALVETCQTNASEARRALYDVGSVDPELSTVEDVETGLDLGVGDDSGETTGASDERTAPERAAGNGAGAGAGIGGRNGAETSAGPGSARGAGGDLPEHERLDHLGSGGTASVHRVELADGSEAALKVPRGEEAATISGRVVEAFVTEAETWAKLDDHPGVVEVLDWGTAPYPWLLLEYMPGGSLARRLPLAPDAAVDALTGVCEAVNHAHTRGVAHADLKPANVLFTDDDRPKVGDWGLANVLLEGVAVDEGLTPAYAAPEQLRDGEVDTATDVYQLGVVAHETLTGENPFAGGGAGDGTGRTDRAGTVDRVLAGAFDLPTTVDPSLPDRADEVIAKAMATDPADRYESVLYLRDALEGIA